MPKDVDPSGTFFTPSSDDATLLAYAKGGDQQAMAFLYDRYSRVVYSVALRVTGDPASAEDVLQEIFMQIWRDPTSFMTLRGGLGGWLAVVSRNRSIDLLRKRRPSDPIEEIPIASSYDLASDAEHNILLERAKGMINLLPVEQKKMLEMAFFEGWSHSEIAERTGAPLGTVKTKIRSALLTLRRVSQA